MTPTPKQEAPGPVDLDKAERTLAIATEELGRLCEARWKGGEAWERAWHWEIPANPERDTDLRIGDALGLCKDLIAEVRRLRPSEQSSPQATDRLEAILRRSKLIGKMLDKKFWDVHMVDIKFRFNGQDVWEEADWIKDLWGLIRRGTPAHPSATEGEPKAPVPGDLEEAWKKLRSELGDSGWSVGDVFTYKGFFTRGWEAARLRGESQGAPTEAGGDHGR